MHEANLGKNNSHTHTHNYTTISHVY